MKNLKEKAIKMLNQKGYDDHQHPTTRRDFIKYGLMAGGGLLLPQNPFQPFLAAELVPPRIPFLVFDLAGGAGLPANFLAGQEGGPEDLCENYKAHGWNPRASGALDKTFGLPMAANASSILNGLRQSLPSEIVSQSDQKLLQMTSILNFSLNDVPDNEASALHLVNRAGLQGSVLKTGLSQMPTLSGGRSQAYKQANKTRPKTITNVEEILSITSLGRKFLEIDQETKSQVFANLKRLGAANEELLRVYTDLESFGELHKKGDPRSSQEMKTAYGLDNVFGGQEGDKVLVQAAITYNVLMGYTGPGAITIEDCDYHIPHPAPEQKDQDIGLAIGRAIHAAHLLKKPLFFQVISDGGVYAEASDNYERVWQGDQSLHSMTIVGFYNPQGNTEIRRLQLGRYTKNAEVDNKTYVGEKPENMVTAVMANYLHLNGNLNQFEELTGIRLRGLNLDDLLLFG